MLSCLAVYATHMLEQRKTLLCHPYLRRIISLFNKVIFLFRQPHHTLQNPTSLEIL